MIKRSLALCAVFCVLNFSATSSYAGVPAKDLGTLANDSAEFRNWANETVGGLTGYFRHVYTWTQRSPNQRYSALNIFSYGRSFVIEDSDSDNGSYYTVEAWDHLFRQFDVRLFDPDGVQLAAVLHNTDTVNNSTEILENVPGVWVRKYSNGGMRLDDIVLSKAGTYRLEVSGRATVSQGGTGRESTTPTFLSFGNSIYAINIRIGKNWGN